MGLGRRRAGGDAGELDRENITASGMFTRLHGCGSEVIIFSSSESRTDEETDGEEEFEESRRRLGQPFLLPLLFTLIYC